MAPPAFDDVSLNAGDVVTYRGFDLEWEASDDDSVSIAVTLTGLAYYQHEDGSIEQTEYTVTRSDLADDGDVYDR